MTSDLVSRVITRQVAYLAASPDYLARHGTPTSPEELAQHKQLASGSRMRLHAWVLTKGDDALFPVAMRPTLVMDSAGALLDAARAGMGIICLPTFLTSTDLQAGRLVPVLPSYRTQEMPISVVFPSRKHLSAKVRLFIHLLSKRVIQTSNPDRPTRLE